MNQPTWIIQTNLGALADAQDLIATVEASGSAVIGVQPVPLSGQLPDVQVAGAAIVYGASHFVADAHASGRWVPGVFAGPDVFTYENWTEHYGSLLLNGADSSVRMTLGQIAKHGMPKRGPVFIRPTKDDKSICGEVLESDKFHDWCLEAISGSFPGIDASTSVIVCEPYGIEAEWRMFMAGDGVLASAQYRKDGRLTREIPAPLEICDFASEAGRLWNPAPLFVLDVCMSAGNPYIVEAQGFNSAGFYGAPLRPIVDAANDTAMRLA